MRWLIGFFAIGCGPAVAPKPVGPNLAAPKAALADEAWGKFHSARNAVTVWLPDGHAWKIDDHSHQDLVAVHERTNSRLTLRLIQDAGELTNREKCERKANLDRFVDTTKIAEVTHEDGIDRNGWDTHILVGTEVAGRDTIGHVVQFSSFIRKCLWVHFETRTNDLAELQDRLLVAHTKILGKLGIDAFDKLPRQAPDLRNP